jgi:hypothetical protein
MSTSDWAFDDGQPANEATASHGDWTFDDGKPAVSEAPPETAGRAAGLTARALAEGSTGLAGTIAEGAATALNPALAVPLVGRHVADWMLEKLTGVKPAPPPAMPSLADLPAAGAQAGTSAADAVGLPTPAIPGERIYSAAVRAVPSAALSPGAPIAGAVSAGLGGAASQTVAENGGGPVAQTVAGLAAGGLPVIGAGAAAATRGLARGGAAGQAAMQARIADAAANNINLTVGQATGARLPQALEASSGRLWGGGSIEHATEKQIAALGSRVDDIVGQLAQGGDVSPTGAGTAINAGGQATLDSMKAAEKSAYGKVDALVPADHPVDVSGTLAKLDQLATPTPGAATTTGALVSPKVAALRDNLRADLGANGGTTIPYNAARSLKTAIGNTIDWGFAPSDPVANGALKQTYGALGDDVNTAASAVSPEAKQAVTDAAKLYAANSERRDFINSVINKAGGPEQVFNQALNGTKQGATKINGVMNALAPDQQNLVRATVLDRLGKALPGQQNAAGDAFDASRFLTNWSRLAPEAKDALFGASGTAGSLRNGLDSLSKTIANIRGAGTVLSNPSGTAKSMGHNLGLWALLSEGAHSIMGGSAAIATGGLTLGGNMILSRALTNPRVVNWLAQSTKAPVAGLPSLVNQLAKMGEAKNDPDAQDLAAYLRSRGVGR